ncbi:LysR family transcriptional regulator [Eubacterium xylanophilum]|uniref:LysR family transcriptional regulator n=1 Tax=Eubacterium xylanophilum TaxID=39497 RepID=UPI00047D34FF|nr:LysR family transcriptional regulator [Eubacterium xylanophilum]
MNTEALQTFVVLASTKSYTKTANQLFVAQSTITKRIKELEKELEIPLFERTNRSVKLTMEGEQFRIYAEQVMELTETSLAQIAAIHHFDRYLRIGSADSIYEGHLANHILAYRKKHPGDSLKISIGLSNHLLDQLQGDLMDVVFTYLPLNKASYSSKVFKQDRLVLVTDISNERYAKGIKQQELVGEKYLMCNFALQDVGEYIRKLFPRFHQFEFVIDDCMKIVPYLLGQDNYTFLPEDMAATYIAEGKLRKVKLLDFQTPIINSYIVYKKSKENILRDFLQIK